MAEEVEVVAGGEPELLLVNDLLFVAVDVAGGDGGPIDFGVTVLQFWRQAADASAMILERAGDGIDGLEVAGELLEVQVTHEILMASMFR
ncbi:MAG: hypothetical protein IPP47_14405 [Bryobacterales bacterium]|nr:hypothetical protein [Bryobacterales bacterium]